MTEEEHKDVDFREEVLKEDGEGLARGLDVSAGDVVTGEVISITDDYVIVDVGLKCEGMISKEEFASLGELDDLSPGSKVEVKVLQRESEDGTARLSRTRASQESRWRRIRESFESGEPVEGEVVEEVRGGFKVRLGVPQTAFLPQSHASLKKRVSAAEVLGKRFLFRIKELDRRRKNIVLSRRALLEEERARERKATLERLEVGSIIKGTVKNITNFGVFVDIGGIDGLITLGDLSWSGFVKDAGSVVSPKEELEVKVLELDPEKDPPRIRLGLKQAKGDPWKGIAERFRPGQSVTGKVKSFTNFGAFVEVEPGVDGLVHISEISWTEHVKHPSKALEINQEVMVKVVEVDEEKKKLSLSVKQAAPDPWAIAYDEYPPGSRVRGTVSGIAPFGVFVRLKTGIEGLVHRTDISWEEGGGDPMENLKEGDEVDAVVMRIAPEEHKIALSMKQARPDPWQEVSRNYPKNKTVSAEVVRIQPEGVALKLDDKTEGWVPRSELSRERVARPEDVVRPGEVVTAKVMKADRKSKRILCSIKAADHEEIAEAIETTMAEQTSGTVTLGEMIGDKLKDLNL